ncbi:hypothetical protein ACIPIN_10650 [Pseudomonas sp. NPDC087697]|uniref:hypothetical protein n=1 Tax=Pseudomonas sp. NPDC087697 TaxID=3364447 RepID=UPI0038212F6D
MVSVQELTITEVTDYLGKPIANGDKTESSIVVLHGTARPGSSPHLVNNDVTLCNLYLEADGKLKHLVSGLEEGLQAFKIETQGRSSEVWSFVVDTSR